MREKRDKPRTCMRTLPAALVSARNSGACTGYSAQVPDHLETNIIVPVVPIVPVAIRHSTIVIIVVPRTATDNAVRLTH
jgi:hypothetical protein